MLSATTLTIHDRNGIFLTVIAAVAHTNKGVNLEKRLFSLGTVV